MSSPFTKGLTISEALYHEGVKPVLAEYFPLLSLRFAFAYFASLR